MRLFLFSIFILFNISSVSAASYEPNIWQAKAIELLKTEQKIVETLWAQDMTLWVSMIDDGTRRDGYAQYVCQTLSEAGRPNGEFIIIHIWDAAKMSKGEMVEIGKSNCSH